MILWDCSQLPGAFYLESLNPNGGTPGSSGPTTIITFEGDEMNLTVTCLGHEFSIASGIDMPNILYCDGHAAPTDLKNLRDPENWGIEGWNRP